jgi:hypothetical protein
MSFNLKNFLISSVKNATNISSGANSTQSSAPSGNLNNFLSEVRSQILPRSDRFEVVFNLPSALQNHKRGIRLASLFCEEATIPGLAASISAVRIGQWTEYRTSNVDFLGSEYVFTFLVDAKWELRSLFESWIDLTSNLNSKEVAYQDDVKGSVIIKALQTSEVVSSVWKLHDVTPKILNITPMSWGNTGYLRTSLSVSSTYWTKELIEAAPLQIPETIARPTKKLPETIARPK